MKITKAQLRKIIKEELLREANGPFGDARDEPVASSIYDDHDEYTPREKKKKKAFPPSRPLGLGISSFPSPGPGGAGAPVAYPEPK